MIKLFFVLSFILSSCTSVQKVAQKNAAFSAKQYDNLRSKRDYKDIRVTNRDFIFRKHQIVGNLNSKICRTAFLNQPVTEDDLIEDMQEKALKIGADAVISFDELKYPSWDTNCRRARAVGVVFKK